MISKFKQVMLLYLRNPSFICVAGILILSAVVSKILFGLKLGSLAEDVTTILFVSTLWMTFHIGILLKRQFSNHRASLLPNYRPCHLSGAVTVYATFFLLAVIWNYSLSSMWDIASHGVQAVYISCFGIALFITYLGYLSVGKAFLYGYMAILLLALYSSTIINHFEASHYWGYGLAVGCLLFMWAFGRRLLRLKDESFEYGCLLTWPPKTYIANQLRIRQWTINLLRPIKGVLKFKARSSDIQPYHSQKGLLGRATHWNYPNPLQTGRALFLLALGIPAYMQIVKNHVPLAALFSNAYSNFLLLAITPVVVTIGSHYKKMGYWGHDLLRPVRKNQYVAEQGLLLLIHLLFYWLIFVLGFSVLPSLIFHSDVFVEPRYWAYLLLTGTFSCVATAWIVWLSCLSHSRAVIVHGIILNGLIVIQFYLASKFNFWLIVWLNVFCVLGATVLLKMAYVACCHKEFDQGRR